MNALDVVGITVCVFILACCWEFWWRTAPRELSAITGRLPIGERVEPIEIAIDELKRQIADAKRRHAKVSHLRRQLYALRHGRPL